MRTNNSVSFSNRILIWFHPFSNVYHNRVTPQRAQRIHRVTPRARQYHLCGHICIGPAKRVSPGSLVLSYVICTHYMLSYVQCSHCTASVLVLLHVCCGNGTLLFLVQCCTFFLNSKSCTAFKTLHTTRKSPEYVV